MKFWKDHLECYRLCAAY